jgi:large subunit ribosomal protein L19e
VYAIPARGPRKKQRKRKKTHGRRKGTKFSRKPAKEEWMETVRAQRKYLGELIAGGELPAEHRRYVYGKIKGRAFKGKKAMRTYLEENGMLERKEKKE